MAISFYALLLLFGPCRLLEFTLAGPQSQIYKILQNLAIIREISDSNLETGRNGSKSGLSQIIREN